MGTFRVEVQGVGNHGCMREIGDGGVVIGCDRPGCPDCSAREFVRRLKRMGSTNLTATLTHWPGTDGQVVDDLITGERTGSF